MIAIVNNTKPIIIYKAEPSIQTFSPPTISLNIPNCERKITIAKPFTNPIITGCGIKRTNFPSLKTPANICIIPIKITVANK